MMKMGKIVVIGSLNFDIITKQKRLPQIGETLTCDSISFCGGGKGANQAVQAAKLGIPTYMIGAVGRDLFGDELMKRLSRYQVDTTYVSQVESPTGMGLVNALEDGKVVATISTGANFSVTTEMIDQAKELIAQSKMVILQLELPVEIVVYAAKLAKKNHNYVILNAAPAKPLPEEIWQYIDCLVVNEPEASFYSGVEIVDRETAIKHNRQLLNRVRDLLIVTLGESGSIVFQGEHAYQIEPYQVTAIETTGAGDSYIGAFAVRKLLGDSPEKAAQYASFVSSMTVKGVGAQGAMPTLEEVMEAKSSSRL